MTRNINCATTIRIINKLVNRTTGGVKNPNCLSSTRHLGRTKGPVPGPGRTETHDGPDRATQTRPKWGSGRPHLISLFQLYHPQTSTLTGPCLKSYVPKSQFQIVSKIFNELSVVGQCDVGSRSRVATKVPRTPETPRPLLRPLQHSTRSRNSCWTSTFLYAGGVPPSPFLLTPPPGTGRSRNDYPTGLPDPSESSPILPS